MIRALAIVAFPLGIGVASAAAGSLSLFAVALGFVLVCAACAAAVELARRRIHVVRTIDRREVLEDAPVALRFAVSGLGALPVRVEVQDAHGQWHTLSTARRAGGRGPDGAAGGAAADDGVDGATIVVDRPGAHIVGPSALRLRDDLGLLTRRIDGGAAQALLVLPIPEPPTTLGRGSGMQHLGDLEPDGLRPYVPGTAMSRIHWPSAARGAELQERHFVTALDALPLVVVDTSGAPEPAAIDWAARAAAGYALTLVRRGGCRIALPGDRAATAITDPTTDWVALHRRLAGLDELAGAAPYAPAPAERDAIWIVASAAPAEGLHERGELPAGVVAVQSGGADAGESPTFSRAAPSLGSRVRAARHA